MSPHCLVTMLVMAVLCNPDVVTSQTPWIRPPSEETHYNTPGLIHATFDSAAMGTEVGYCVVLPCNYSCSNARYPVVYWLHGGGGNESSTLFTAQLWGELAAAGQIAPVILVYPNGFRSGYMDHADGKTMNETMIIRELIPLVDAAYRTIKGREGRAVHGFSMGASGALRFAIKYPELFCSAVAYGGGAIDLELTTDPWVLDILERNLDSDPQRVRQHNTYHFLKLNHETVRRSGTQFFLICGGQDSWHASAVNFHQALRAKQIECRLTTVPDVAHELGKLYQAEGKAAALFQDGMFKKLAVATTYCGLPRPPRNCRVPHRPRFVRPWKAVIQE